MCQPLKETINALSTVPINKEDLQGAHLGPLLFSLFINDIANILHGVDFCIYADDLKIYKEIKNIVDALMMQDVLNRLHAYIKLNNLSLNVRKCFVVSFTRKTTGFIYHPYEINGSLVQRKESIKDLGVIYDSKITFNDHVDSICSKARKMLGFVMRVGKNFRDPYTFTTLYNSIVRSHLEYASVIWNPFTSTQRNKLERVQHKFLAFVSAKCK